jgi:hypothetical protein
MELRGDQFGSEIYQNNSNEIPGFVITMMLVRILIYGMFDMDEQSSFMTKQTEPDIISVAHYNMPGDNRFILPLSQHTGFTTLNEQPLCM